MKIDKTILIDECLELILLHKNIQCEQKDDESDLDWYVKILGLVNEIKEEPERNSASDKATVLVKALVELIEDEK